MKNKFKCTVILSAALLLLFTGAQQASADTLTSGPWKFYSGASVIQTFTYEHACLDKLNSMPAGTTERIYNCEYRHRRVVSAIDNHPIPTPDPHPTPDPTPTPDPHPVPTPDPIPAPDPVPDPTPTPDPIPDPVPPSTADCDATINNSVSIQASFSLIANGQTLCLEDGVYKQAVNVPSNKGIAAVNTGQAIIDGSELPDVNWKFGTLSLEGTNSSATGLKVHYAPEHWDACKINGSNHTFKNMSCSHGGRYKHKIPLIVGGSGHLIEDSWFYGEGRYTVQCFRGNNIAFRNNVVRWDKTIPNEPNEPNAAMSNYSCNDMVWEHNLSLDYGVPITPMKHCGDYCMSSNTNEPNLRVQYISPMIVNHSLGTLNNYGLRADQKGNLPSSDISITDFFVSGAVSPMYFNPKYQNVTVNRCTNNTNGAHSDKGQCTGGNAVINSTYINQSLIKLDMCASGERQSDWCNSNLNLSDYIKSF